MIPITAERKLRYLNEWMVEWIDLWPKKPKPFDRWLESTLDKKAHKGRKNHINQQKTFCRYCKRSFEAYSLEKTKDHIVPTSRGGFDKKENRVPCCHDCNQWKSDKNPELWLKELERLIKKEKKIQFPYNKHLIGIMIGQLRVVITEAKEKQNKISQYKF